MSLDTAAAAQPELEPERSNLELVLEPDSQPDAASASVPGTPTKAFAYLTTERASHYRELMGVLLDNKRRFGLPLAPERITRALWERYSSRYPTDEGLERDLDALHGWGAIDRYQDSSRASSTAEFKRKRFTYDITAAGEVVERAALQIDRLADRIGALRSSQLPELLEALNELARECERREPRPPKLVAAFNDIASKLERIRDDTGDFMRDLGAVMASEQVIDAEPFERYKRRVIDHLQGFRSELVRLDGQFAAAIDRIEAVGVDSIVQLAAESDEPPVWGLSDEEITERRAARLADEWSGVRRWFRGERDEPPPWRELDRALGDAIEWIIGAAQRLIDRRSLRVDRSSEYRALAQLFHRADSLADCNALYVAAFGLYAPRHFSVPEADCELTGPTTSWWEGVPAPVQASLYRPGARIRHAGRAAKLADHSAARAALAATRERERAELARALERFSGRGPLRLGSFDRLDRLEFDHLLRWLARALDAAGGKEGVRRAESQDGLVRLALRPPPAAGGQVEITTPNGTFLAPDYEVEVEPA